MAEALNLVLISGSVRPFSFTRALTLHMMAQLENYGASCEHWDPGNETIPLYDPEYHHSPDKNPHPWARRFSEAAASADGFVFASPIYHNSCSGLLKMMIDHLAIAQVQYKPVALISHGGNRSTQAVDQLRIVARGLLGIAIPAQVCSAEQDFSMKVGTGPELVATDIIQRIGRASAELIAFAKLLRPLRSPIR
ncbi:NAD(P)H-dependent oxidoreductase [Sphingomonas psychrotolerans]|uniref:NAD(P)H-dependent oxidoreductase n=1 Tax=Sphingomonas psychrotolerans TaxID=1327635 RepID=A0ABU3MY13_9SPHN|nr:NADPH-dependent FMN reductase [Sphingomonas psychrotolerans]MDT8757200.1 NAD(P)H-dependent oxidoreductase [Sphingomonas psychrotolerans]